MQETKEAEKTRAPEFGAASVLALRDWKSRREAATDCPASGGASVSSRPKA
jgi:hypothetical protein